MFNKDFYPTPQEVIERMLLGENVTDKVVLEPSAGKGDIIDYLHLNGAEEVLCCENNEELAVIAGSKARLIEKDFINVTSDQISHIDMIIMNPPFSADEKHINHAFDIAPPGCQIISLCNYNTYHDARGWLRGKFKKTIETHGSIEHLGDAFSTAERTTDADIGLVKLYKPKGNSEDEFDGYFDLEEEIEEQGEGIMGYNEIRDTVNRYVAAVKMFDSVVAENEKINQLIKPILSSVNISFGVHGEGINGRDSFKKELQKSAWRSVFSKLKMQKYTTRSVMDDLNRFVEKQQNVPFTMSNIYKMMEMVIGTHSDRMRKVLVEVFDWLTDHHHENRMSVEGWKTNSMYMVNRKFIAPYCGIQHNWGNGAPEIRWSQQGEKMDELVKALCFLTGYNYENCVTLHDFFRGEPVHKDSDIYNRKYKYKEWGTWYDFNFFWIKVYKKGTLHAKFKDKKVWELFNQACAKAKGWRLPTKTGSDFKSKGTEVEIY